MKLLFFLGSASISLALSLANNGTSPIVDLGYSKYQGTFDSSTGNTVFLGVRYAAPPLGQLRFAKPRSPLPTSELQIADTLPVECVQSSGGTAPQSPFPVLGGGLLEKRQAIPSSEDCLFLNVYTAGQLSKAKNFPVLVWIHGGGYAQGGMRGFVGTDIQNGDDLVHEANGGVVVVVIQYRLGLFGFLSGEKVKQGGALNAGLLDQEYALKWVQKHITKFGGDPSKVTIWGESAGGGSVLQHVIAHGGKTTPPLFRGAIASSPYLPSQYQYNHEIPETIYTRIVEQANCSSSSDTLKCLRNADLATLESANSAILSSGLFGTFILVPVVDGTFIQEPVHDAFKKGKVNGQALYVVTNTVEGSLFVDPTTADTVQVPTYIANLFPRLSRANVLKAAEQYKGLGPNIEQVTRVVSETWFLCPAYSLLDAFKKKGPTYKAFFAVPPAHHGEDINYYFPSTPIPGPIIYNNTQFQTAFSGSFMAFVKSLNPNKHVSSSIITPPWPTWDGKTRKEMLFNHTEDLKPWIETIKTSDGVLERCRFWESVASETAQ